MDAKKGEFLYQFCSNGTKYQLRVPVKGLLSAARARELTSRLVRAHNLPCYLEDELCSQLEAFARDKALRECDYEGDELVKLAGDSTSEVGKRIDLCVDRFTKNCSEFSVATVTHDNEPTFSDMYHSLIHSPALDTLLQLEHTYAIAMENSLQAWKNARDIITKRHDSELREKMAEVSGSRATEEDLAGLMREHERDRTVLEVQWRGELMNLRQTQQSSYQQWINGAYREMTSSGTTKSSHFAQSKRVLNEEGDDVFSGGGEGRGEDQLDPPLEESFTIHLGAQLKSTHNIRLLCGNALSLCHERVSGGRGGGILAQPERLQTAMSLYSTKLHCLILMVEPNIGQPSGMEQKFSDICHQTSDLHFPDYSDQLSSVLDAVACVSESRASAGQQLESSSSSQTSELSTPRGESPFYHHHDNKAPHGLTDSDSSTHHFLSPPPPATPTSGTVGSRQSPGRSGGREWALPEQEPQSATLEPGDFFITRHSNLSQVHVVLHLATDKEAVRDPGLRARHPVMAGLKNCLHVAARNDVHHITLPLLLVHHMEPEMTIPWCLKRAELVFKCVKGFMLENPLWGNGDSRTIQFLIPKNISQDLFEEICDMLPKIFRVATTRKLTSRTRSRTHSYK